jgi:flagellar M-ring protein FliF
MDPQQLLTRFKSLGASLTPGQVASMVAAFLLVVGIIAGGAWWANTPSYALLYADMDAETASNMVTRLKTLKVPYSLDEGGRAIRVPVGRVDELRLELAADGPESGRPGFEIFDRTQFGATEFQEQVNLRRALEGELARTIGTLNTVDNARVHISLGKETLFGDPRPAKASVVLKLRGTRDLPGSSVNAISNLVASSVDGLRADAVTIMDSYGRPLARPAALDETVPGSAAQTERQQLMEREMSARVVALLAPVIGEERVRVNVALRLNPATVEQTEETYDPIPVVRSKQSTADQTTTTLPGGGLAGVRSNQPAPQPDPKAAPQTAQAQGQAQTPAQPQAVPMATPPTGTGATRTAETVNYEINRTLVVTQRPPGEIARMSLAVIVDDEQVVKKAGNGTQTISRKPRTPEELQQLQSIVAAAVGLEPERGDQLTVQNVSFEEAPTDEPAPMTTVQQITQYSNEIWEGARIAAVVALGLMAMLFFVRPLMQRVNAGAAGRQQALALAGPGQPLRTVADLESEIEAQLDASAQQKADGRRLPVLARKVSSMSAKEPENVAKLLRSWINEGER